MLLVFVLFAVISLAVVLAAAFTVTVGLVLLTKPGPRRLGILLILISLGGAVGAMGGAWGLAFLGDHLSKASSSPAAWQAWQVLTLWAWPVGLVGGGALGTVAGAVAAALMCRRGPSQIDAAA